MQYSSGEWETTKRYYERGEWRRHPVVLGICRRVRSASPAGHLAVRAIGAAARKRSDDGTVRRARGRADATAATICSERVGAISRLLDGSWVIEGVRNLKR